MLKSAAGGTRYSIEDHYPAVFNPKNGMLNRVTYLFDVWLVASEHVCIGTRHFVGHSPIKSDIGLDLTFLLSILH